MPDGRRGQVFSVDPLAIFDFSPVGSLIRRLLARMRRSIVRFLLVRRQVPDWPLLQDRLAEAVDFVTQAKQAHWNAKGPNFLALDELFDQVYEHASEHVDLIAERIVQLGGTTEGMLRVGASRSRLPKYPVSIAHGGEYAQALSHSLACFGEEVRAGIDKADEIRDRDTVDILTQISRSVDKALRFPEAHAQ